ERLERCHEENDATRNVRSCRGHCGSVSARGCQRRRCGSGGHYRSTEPDSGPSRKSVTEREDKTWQAEKATCVSAPQPGRQRCDGGEPFTDSPPGDESSTVARRSGHPPVGAWAQSRG